MLSRVLEESKIGRRENRFINVDWNCVAQFKA
jgi:hypothetical protein